MAGTSKDARDDKHREKEGTPVVDALRETDIAMIDCAADLRGRSRTDFVREAAVRAAEAVVLELSLIHI